MGIIIKEFTGKDIFEAIEKDGFKILRKSWIEGKGPNVSACLLGMAALNLGVVASGGISSFKSKYTYDNFPAENTLYNQLNTVRTSNGNEGYSIGVGEYIVSKFDERIIIFYENEGVDDNVRPFLPADFALEFDQYIPKFEISRYREAVDAYIDSLTLDETQGFTRNHWQVEFYKLSWKAAVEMCREVLTPYFDHVFHIAAEDYSELLDWTPPNLQAA